MQDDYGSPSVEPFEEGLQLRSLKIGGAIEKHGIPTGKFAINPDSGELVPIWVANYVLIDYGTGAIMSVPGHDERDFEFAKKYAIPIRRVIGSADPTTEQPANSRAKSPWSPEATRASAALSRFCTRAKALMSRSRPFPPSRSTQTKRARPSGQKGDAAWSSRSTTRRGRRS